MTSHYPPLTHRHRPYLSSIGHCQAKHIALSKIDRRLIFVHTSISQYLLKRFQNLLSPHKQQECKSIIDSLT